MILLCYGLVNYNNTCCTAVRARISYVALDAASLPLLPHVLQERDGEQERHVVQDELGHLDGEDKQDHCGLVVDSEVPGSLDLVYWGE